MKDSNYYKSICLFQSPCPSALDFWKIEFEKSSSMNWIFSPFRTGFLQATQAVKIQFEIDVELDFSKIECRRTGGIGLICNYFDQEKSIENIGAIETRTAVSCLHRAQCFYFWQRTFVTKGVLISHRVIDNDHKVFYLLLTEDLTIRLGAWWQHIIIIGAPSECSVQRFV